MCLHKGQTTSKSSLPKALQSLSCRDAAMWVPLLLALHLCQNPCCALWKELLRLWKELLHCMEAIVALFGKDCALWKEIL